jgi:hypothetical protein
MKVALLTGIAVKSNWPPQELSDGMTAPFRRKSI